MCRLEINFGLDSQLCMCVKEVDEVREKPGDTARFLTQKNLRVKANKQIYTLLNTSILTVTNYYILVFALS